MIIELDAGVADAQSFRRPFGSVATNNANDFNNDWAHVYIVWDKNKTLSGNTKTVRVWMNGTEILNTDVALTWQPDLQMSGYMGDRGDGSNAFDCYLDNIKWWDFVVAEDPSWEYNSGIGREDALNIIYSSKNEYKPVLNIENNSGVGYYKQ